MIPQSEHITEQCHCTVCRLHALDAQTHYHTISRSGFAIAAERAVPSIPVGGTAVSSRGRG